MFSRLTRVANSQLFRNTLRTTKVVSNKSNTLAWKRLFSSSSNSSSKAMPYLTSITGAFCGASLLFAASAFADNQEPCEECTPCEDECCPCHDANTHPCTKAKHFVPGCHELKIFGGNGNMELTERVAAALGTKPGKCVVGRFNDGEVNIQILESVRGKDVYVIQPTSAPVSDRIMELLLMVLRFPFSRGKSRSVVFAALLLRRSPPSFPSTPTDVTLSV